uniref:Uncharacterized protein n=1 Tax=Arundo donax TaxID=35708 RepID=A0A0A8YMF2_ARUDO
MHLHLEDILGCGPHTRELKGCSIGHC